MPTIQLKVTVELDEQALSHMAEILGPAINQALQLTADEERRRQVQLTVSRDAIYAGQTPSDDEHLLIDSRRAAKLLGISERTLWGR